jgi:hypothetical protein
MDHERGIARNGAVMLDLALASLTKAKLAPEMAMATALLVVIPGQQSRRTIRFRRLIPHP